MQEVVMSLITGMPTAAVLFYILVTNNRDHMKERDAWRQTLEQMNDKWQQTMVQKDNRMFEVQNIVAALTKEIEKLTYIIENYVVGNRKNKD